MPNEIVWLPESTKDLARLREFLQNKNPLAAQRAGSRIKKATNLFYDNPEAGKPVAGLTKYREIFISFGNGNYVIRYRLEHSKVIIVRVKHSRENAFKVE